MSAALTIVRYFTIIGLVVLSSFWGESVEDSRTLLSPNFYLQIFFTLAKVEEK